jgi:hypothetical protein
MNRDKVLEDFFRRYADVSLGAEPERLAEFYEGSFLAAGPKGGEAFRNDKAFLSWLREVSSFNARTGMVALAVGDIDQKTVSADYSLATVEWAATFRQRDEPIRFRISYLLRLTESRPRIAAYISHEDQQEAMQAHGLL